MKVLIVEDEIPAREGLKINIERAPFDLNILGETGSGQEAIHLIDQLKPEAIFLDIQLLDMSGFEVLNQIQHDPFIIFTTAYQEYALKAFEYHSIDYLLKPIEQARFNQAIQKLLDLQNKTASFSANAINSWMAQQKQQNRNSLPVPKKDRILLINYEDIVFFQAEDKYVSVVQRNGKSELLAKSMNKLEHELPDDFIRVHRSYIVNRQYVYEIGKFFKGRWVLKLNDPAQSQISSSKGYAEQIRAAFGL